MNHPGPRDPGNSPVPWHGRASRIGPALLLVAHGSRDRRAARSTRSLVRAVGAACPGLRVGAAFLDFTAPSVASALAAAPGGRGVTVVPLLLTAAYHGRVDLPGVLAGAVPAGTGAARPEVSLAEVLGPVGPDDAAVRELFVAGLRRRLAGLAGNSAAPDAVVLAAAGSRRADALSTVEDVAVALGASLGVPCLPGYASAGPRTVGEAVAELRTAGARRIATAAYFLAPGLLHDRAVDQALRAGAVAVAAPLGDAQEMVTVVLHRAATRAPVPAGA
ncbi:MAG: cobalamin biosynthesis protein CbiX [Micromonosporaceae bacterium]|nr:cobalamin biosynthesis protein CbiX [Micromonosporaceae bacterium]